MNEIGQVRGPPRRADGGDLPKVDCDALRARRARGREPSRERARAVASRLRGGAAPARLQARARRELPAQFVTFLDAAGANTITTELALAWATPLFEFYGVAEVGAGRKALSAAANRVVGWVRREEERVFIIGGAVF